jgi:Domain of unknown function (DUF4376)
VISMGYYIDSQGNYYEGDKQSDTDLDVPKRATYFDTWSGDAWDVSPVKRWNEIKTMRDKITQDGGCFVSGKWYHTDPYSKQQIMALTILGASIPNNIQWKTMDGSFVTMNQALVSQIFISHIIRDQAIFANAESLKLNSADISTGWPPVYSS